MPTIQVRIPKDRKEESEKILAGMGLSLSQAIRIFLNEVVTRQAIPFIVELPPGK